MPKQTRRQRLIRQILNQIIWIEKCGSTLSGYIANHGDPGVPPLENGQPKTLIIAPDKQPTGKFALDPVPGQANTFYFPHSGDGGTAIFRADMDHLHSLEEQLRVT